MSFKKEVIKRLDRIDSHLSDQDKIITSHTVEMRVYNKELADHTKRSTMLEERFKPIEDIQIFWNKFTKVALAVVSVVATVATIYYRLKA
jgi:hypothetical protein